jgi:hypothetical protein
MSGDFMSALQDFTPTAIDTQDGRMNIRQNLKATELCTRTFPDAVSMHVS